jgi:DNA-binding NarL/FixJ family response regulator
MLSVYNQRVSEMPEGLIKVALVEPVASDAARIKELVATGSIPAEITDALTSERPDLAEAEIIMIGLQALGTTERELLVRMRAGFPRTPLVVLAGSDTSWASEAVRLGAHHVLIKSDLTPKKMASTIRYFVHYALHRKRASTDTLALDRLPLPQSAHMAA